MKKKYRTNLLVLLSSAILALLINYYIFKSVFYIGGNKEVAILSTLVLGTIIFIFFIDIGNDILKKIEKRKVQ